MWTQRCYRLWFLTLIGLLLAGCATAEPEAGGFAPVPLPEFTQAQQQAAFRAIIATCGPQIDCPPGAILERSVLDYVKLRAEVRAAGGK